MGVETLIGPAASVVGGMIESDATSGAADAQSAATAAGIAENRRQFDLTRSDYAPYRTVGTNALRRLAALYGLDSGADMASPTASSLRNQLIAQYNDGLGDPIQMDPGYQFGLQQGQQALDRKIAAAGGRVSGAALKAAQRFGTDYATTGYSAAYQRRQDSLNRLQALAGIGQTSTGASAAAGDAAAARNASLISGMGNAQAGAALNQGSIWGNAINQAGAAWQRNQRQGYGTPGYWPSDQGMSWGYDK